MIRSIILAAFMLVSFGFSTQVGWNTKGEVLELFVKSDCKIKQLAHLADKGRGMQVGDGLKGEELLLKVNCDGVQEYIYNTQGAQVVSISPEYKNHNDVKAGTVLLTLESVPFLSSESSVGAESDGLSFGGIFQNLWLGTGIYDVYKNTSLAWTDGLGRVIMICVGLLLLFLAIHKGFEPLLLVPMGMGAVLANIPLAFINEPGGILHFVYESGIATGIFPLIIFMGVGAMTDFAPMLANPITLFLGAAAQFGIFATLIGAIALSGLIPGIDFSFQDASSIAIIGGADGPTSIFVASRLSPRLLASIAVAAYSYMALVPIIQPPIMRLLTNEKERKIKMVQLRHVSKAEKIIFPVLVVILCGMLLPSAAPLIGFLMFGNLMRESGVVERLRDTTTNSLINIVTIFLGLGVGSKLSADKFLNLETLGIIVLGLVAFSFGTAAGVVMARVLNLFVKNKINPLIGSAGVSAVPMAARVSNKVGLEYDNQNFLLMHAMGPNVAGVIGSAVAAGVLLAVFQ